MINWKFHHLTLSYSHLLVYPATTAKTDLPSTSDLTTLLLNTPVGVSERVSYDDTSLSHCTDSNTQKINSCPKIPPIVDHQSTDTSLGNKRICFFCKKRSKTV